MRRSSFSILGLLLIPTAAFGQTGSTDSQTLQALLAEVRHLRQDLQTTNVAAQRAQILLYRLQAQEATVARALQRVDDARSKLAETQTNQKIGAAEIKQYEEIQSRTENPKERKEIEEVVSRLKAKLEMWASEEQQKQTREIEAKEQLQMEQAKLSALQDQLERLEKALENFGQQPGSGPHWPN